MDDYWQEVHRRAFAETCVDLGIASQKQVMVKAFVGVAIIVALVLWGSEGAPRDELVMRGALIAVVIFLFPIVYIYNFIKTPPQLAKEMQGRTNLTEIECAALRREKREAEAVQKTGFVGQHALDWANERLSHRIEKKHDKFQYMFSTKLRATPTIIQHYPVPGNPCIVLDVSDLGFTVNFKNFEYRLPFRFFADSREVRPHTDALEDTLNGKWFGDRFLFNQPKLLFEEHRTGIFTESVILPLSPCPVGSIAEIYLDCGPSISATGLMVQQTTTGRKNIDGRIVIQYIVGEGREITLENYTPISPLHSINYSEYDVSIRAELLGWIQ